MFMEKGYCHIDGKACTINFCGGSERVCGPLQIGKQIGKLLDVPTSPGPKTHLLGLECEKSGNLVPFFENFENNIKMLTKLCAEWL